MSKDTLIRKLEAKWKPSAIQVGSPLIRLDEVLEIIRQHQAEPPQDVVERVAKAIQEAMYWNGTVMCTSAENLAKAAIAAMGDAANG